MALHRQTSVELGVPNVARTAAYYEEFGLRPLPGGRGFSTVDGGEQLRISHSDRRRLLRLGVGADDPDDLDRVAAELQRLDVPVERTTTTVSAVDIGTGTHVEVTLAPRLQQSAASQPHYNAPGRIERANVRADGVLRTEAVRPRKLGHVALGSTDLEASQRFFAEGIGFKISDTVQGQAAFLRCSTDHHNVMVHQAPVQFLHHSSWQVDDVDEVGRGATAMLAADSDRHVWGLGHHHVGSNFFWYLKDPAGNFAEYYSDMDCVVDDQLWQPGVWEGSKGLYSWGPPPPPSFLAPEDLAALMTGTHSL